MLRYILETAPPLHTFSQDGCLQKFIKVCVKFMLRAHSEYWVKTVLFRTRINNLLLISPVLDSYLMTRSNNLVEERGQPKFGYKMMLAGEVGQPLLYLLG